MQVKESVLFGQDGQTLGGKTCSAENINQKMGKSRADVDVRGKNGVNHTDFCDASSSA